LGSLDQAHLRVSPFREICVLFSFFRTGARCAWEILHTWCLPSGILQTMQQPTASVPTASPSFAGLMAALADSKNHGDGSSPPKSNSASAWNDDELAEDIATLSYESALRAHSRYRPPSPSHSAPSNSTPSNFDQSLTQAPDPKPTRFEENPSDVSAAVSQTVLPSEANPEPEASRLQAAQLERNLKGASVTIRMSKAECAQLHQRAAEAGLTVSAYLRSCTFEAESLRAMVKETLAQLRSATAQPTPAAAPLRRAWLGRAFRRVAGWLTPWHGSQRVARA
jgi:predicted DNA binding CopG/RHH family protein